MTSDADDAGTCPLNERLTAADLDNDPGYASGRAPSTGCTPADLTQIGANTAGTVSNYLDFVKGISSTCNACAVANRDAPFWAPLVLLEADGTRGFVDYGACAGSLEGDTCGKAMQYEQFCLETACAPCAPEAHAECIQEASRQGGMCESFVSTRNTACPNFAATLAKCKTFQLVVQHMCAAAPDAGDGG